MLLFAGNLPGTSKIIRYVQIPRWLLWLILLLLPLAFFVNLGLQPFIDDEGNRSVVALEMLWSGNYIVPTIHGAFYYNKPPLWNWVLAASFWLHGGASEWAARVPSVLALLGFAATIYYTFRQHFSAERALLGALIFLTCGRIIFWESLLGLIDISFSWAMFGLFLVVYHFGQRGQWRQLFLWSYLLMVVGFMFKGLPAFVFQGLTLVTYLVARGQWKRLFSVAHIGSGLLAVGLLALYYAAYHQYNSLDHVFQALFEQSGKRTAAAYGIGETLRHLVSFPGEVFYHFLPWTLPALLLVKKTYRQRLRDQPFVQYCLLILAVNSTVYWLSPNFHPRYILMLVPLGVAALVQLLPDEAGTDRLLLVLRGLFGLLIVLTIGVSAGSFFHPDVQAIPWLWLKSGGITMSLLILGYIYYRHPAQQWFLVVAVLLVFRLGFDLLVPPARAAESNGNRLRELATNFGHRWQDRQLTIFRDGHMEPTNSFYVENAMGHVLPRTTNGLQVGQLYLYHPDQYDRRLFGPAVDSLPVRHTYSDYIYVAPLLDNDSLSIEQATLQPPAGF